MDVTVGEMATAVRMLAADMVEAAGSGEDAMAGRMALAATVLFAGHLRFDPESPGWPDRDRFVVSSADGAPLLYALLHLAGYAAWPLESLERFRRPGSRAPGYLTYDRDAGIEATAWPPGQGLGFAVGMALAERTLHARFGDGLVDHRTFVIVDAADVAHGICHEACALAGHLRLDRLTVLYDAASDADAPAAHGPDVEDVCMRFAAYGWDCQTVAGGDAEAIGEALGRARSGDRPSLICCRPVGDGDAGSERPAGWPAARFVVPPSVVRAWRALGERGHGYRLDWEARLAAADADVRTDFGRVVAGDLPTDLAARIAHCKRTLANGSAKLATRRASAEVLEELVPAMPELVGGSADLTDSNGTKAAAVHTAIAAGTYGGRYIHYGIREHAMAAAMTGMALHGGVIPYAGSFLIFMDYCRTALRLAAQMRQRIIFVMTHDSIGLGEDGPTHQPTEQLSSLRAVPNVLVLRPADALETAECWELALRHTDGPSILSLTRQAFRTSPANNGTVELSRLGAYVYVEASDVPRVTILATGSEMEVAQDARRSLEGEGTPTRVVSVPSWELFERQDAAYRASLLGDGSLKVAIEAGGSFGWERYIGPDGLFIGMRDFGASAPYADLYRHFGITADAVVAAVRSRLGVAAP